MFQSRNILSEQFSLQEMGDYFKVSFSAMASSCEFLIACDDEVLARNLSEDALSEVRRIEHKYSRYKKNNLCYAINTASGAKIAIDEETYRLLNFAQTCYELSEGLFDLTSGVLRRAWVFDCSQNIPSQKDIDVHLAYVGWHRVKFDPSCLQMDAGMEIDFGGIAKEYAVSRVVEICKQKYSGVSVLVNLGGDLQITEAQSNRKPWIIGVESVRPHQKTSSAISLVSGALATSGDSKRYLLKGEQRYSHILNPKTGWPMTNAPSSVTVVAPLCIQAGCLATLALLNGNNAEDFLADQDLQYWCNRS